MHTAIAKSRKSTKSLLVHLSIILPLLKINPTMSATDLRPHLVQHLPSHQSVTAQYIVNFFKKAIKYLAVHDTKGATFTEAQHLLKPSAGQETIASDSAISKERVESILATTMADNSNIWDVLK